MKKVLIKILSRIFVITYGLKKIKLKRKLRGNNKIIIGFYILQPETWKFDSLYKELDANQNFEVKIFCCPSKNLDNSERIFLVERTFKFFTEKGYHAKKYNFKNKNKNKCFSNVDIIFYNNPYKGVIFDELYAHRNINALKCYIPYAYMNGLQRWAYDQPLISLCWKVFYPSNQYKKTAITISNCNWNNIEVSGYPTYDLFQSEKKNTPKEWMQGSSRKIRIIWAPHHSIDKKIVDNSTFQLYHELFIQFAQSHQNQVEIAFRPHPLLKYKLYQHKDWGKEKTDNYYTKWQTMSNTFISEGDYINLFIHSDCLIHDCGSFMIEYLYTKKPAIYISNQKTDYLSMIGKSALDAHYRAYNFNEIKSIFNQLFFESYDPIKEQRDLFFNSYLKQEELTSKSIYNTLIKELC